MTKFGISPVPTDWSDVNTPRAVHINAIYAELGMEPTVQDSVDLIVPTLQRVYERIRELKAQGKLNCEA